MTDNVLPLQLMADIDGLSIFSSIRQSLLLHTFRDLLRNLYTESDPPTADYVLMAVNTWASFINAFASDPNGNSFYEKIACIVVRDDNVFTRAAEKKPPRQVDSMLITAAKTDLTRLGRIASANVTGIGFTIAKDLRTLGLSEAASGIENECRSLWSEEGRSVQGLQKDILSIFPSDDWGTSVEKFAEYINKTGAGEFGQHHAFNWKAGDHTDKKHFRPVINQDKIRLNDLCGYEDLFGREARE